MGEKKRPNILFIMSDDHSANAISCYNSILSSIFKTPNLDRLGEEGKRLDGFYATNSICTPARATIMTGQYGNVNGVRTLEDKWNPLETLNLAQILQDNNYKTGMLGKWHLGCEPIGFDDYKYLTDGYGQGVYFNPSFKEKDKGEVRYEGYVSDIITDMSIDWIKNRDSDKPFFLMCHHKAPHDFWEYHERYEHLFDDIDIPIPDSLFEDRSHRSEASRDFGSSVTPRSKIRSLYEDFCKKDYITGPLENTENMTFEEKGIAAYEKYIKDYLRTVASIDDSVGRILEELENEGIIDDTIVIYTSDQGMFLGEHDYQDKRWSYEESLKAPFLIRYPKLIKEKTNSKRLVANIDIAPTLLDIAGIDIPEEMQGISVKNMLANDEPTRDAVYFRYWMHLAHRHHNPAHYGIRTDKWKLIFYYGLGLDASGASSEKTPSGWELYDMENDPKELHNLYDNPSYIETIKELKEKLIELKAKYKDQDYGYQELIEVYNSTK
ncbi:acetylglucosamine-6-sulfatase [Vallitalea longa]|uniref:Acetylglucosamine-6-sulfatase n=1 Tax=Vallitalea longa TaxID=2936439 RepID=A0A9W6DDD3_9FIRM|nr:sulfatase [Vallitalea longa]GKX27960.1 acetylglucosamine-6-sulfatase [Vallitalea longa]